MRCRDLLAAAITAWFAPDPTSALLADGSLPRTDRDSDRSEARSQRAAERPGQGFNIHHMFGDTDA